MSIVPPIAASGAIALDEPAAEPVVSVRGLTKTYGVVEALRDVSIDFHAGEIHAVVGENGAGKSTLTRLLGGEELPDAGDIFVGGRKTLLLRPGDARRAGIALVHQQFQLVEALTVAENVCLEDPPTRRLMGIPIVDRREMLRRAEQQLAPFNLASKAGADLRALTVAERQVVEISRELAKDAHLLVLDEPTSALSADETETLFAHVRALRDKGVAILFIAHSLTEVLAIADRITVLRDGRLVTTVPARTLDASTLSQLIVGREIAKPVPAKAHTGEHRVILEANSGGRGIEIRRREVFGIPTYIGSAVRDLLDRLSGLRRANAGEIRLEGEDIGRSSIGARVRKGLCFVPGDSTAEGLVPKLSVEDNTLLPSITRFTRAGIIDRHAARRAVRELIARLDIRPADPHALVERLSGGNRQKVAIAKWLLSGADVLIMDDPARGVDVGAKVELYRVIAGHAESGGAVVLASSDLDELLALSDRLVVLRGEAVLATFPERPFVKADIVRTLAARQAAARPEGTAS